VGKSFCDVIAALQGFWAEKGCYIAQPYDIEKGAGTMNPFTFFRVLGREPWKIGYVEPSRRPQDARTPGSPAPERPSPTPGRRPPTLGATSGTRPFGLWRQVIRSLLVPPACGALRRIAAACRRVRRG
jgi:hypothetical protein